MRNIWKFVCSVARNMTLFLFLRHRFQFIISKLNCTCFIAQLHILVETYICNSKTLSEFENFYSILLSYITKIGLAVKLFATSVSKYKRKTIWCKPRSCKLRKSLQNIVEPCQSLLNLTKQATRVTQLIFMGIVLSSMSINLDGHKNTDIRLARSWNTYIF